MWIFNKYRKLDWDYIYNEVLPKAAKEDPEAMKILKGYCGGEKKALSLLMSYKLKVAYGGTERVPFEDGMMNLVSNWCEAIIQLKG